MLALCNGGKGGLLDGASTLEGSSTSTSTSSSAGSGGGAEASPGGSGGQGPPTAGGLPPQQQRLSALLARLFGDGSIVKSGFGLQTDLARLCESYPWLPCFGAEGPVPLRWAGGWVCSCGMWSHIGMRPVCWSLAPLVEAA